MSISGPGGRGFDQSRDYDDPPQREPIDQLYQGKSLEGLREDVLDVNFPDRIDRANVAERIAQRFHETYEEIAPTLGYQTREASAVPWEDVPERNRSLMVAVVMRLLEQGVITAATGTDLNAEES